jgi:hypothetical protein
MRWQVQQSVLLRGDLALQYFCVLWRFHAAKMVYQVLKLVAQSICHVANYLAVYKQMATSLSIVSKEVDCLLPVEHFRAVALHHMLMDNMGYLKTVVDFAQIRFNQSKIYKSKLNHG